MVKELRKHLDGIKRAQVSPSRLAAFSSEEDFNGIGVEILIEAGSYVCVAACALPGDTRRWDRNQAIVGGLVVRLYKLISAMLDQTCQRRRETTFVFARLSFETIVNIRYLITHSSEELFDSYVRYSLRHERKLHDRIKGNIAERGGNVLPIEERMLRSIRRTEENSGVALADVEPGRPKNWGDKNLFERAEAVGLMEPYLAAFGGGSHTVHGNWMDLLEYHLVSVEDGFQPQLEWRYPRPQLLFATTIFTVEALRDYFSYVGGETATLLVEPKLLDLWQRNKMASEAHEKFLINHMHRDASVA